MLTLDFVNARGGVLSLVNNKYFYISNIDGMTDATASLSSNTVGGVDGDSVNNAQAQPRGIVIDLTIRPTADVEEAKRAILDVVKLKQQAALIWTQSGRTWTISGIVELANMPRWNNEVTIQLALHCEQPFWEDIEYVVEQISEAISLHYFTDSPDDMLYFPEEGIAFGEYDALRTKSFYNSGDVAVGLEITIVALQTVTNPIIYDANGRFFGLGYDRRPLQMNVGDTITINTTRGQKSVMMNGYNILDYLKPRSTFPQLETGENTFSINSDDETISNMHFNIAYKQRYI